MGKENKPLEQERELAGLSACFTLERTSLIFSTSQLPSITWSDHQAQKRTKLLSTTGMILPYQNRTKVCLE